MSSFIPTVERDQEGGSKMKGALRRMVGRQKKPSSDPPCVKVLDAQGSIQVISQSDEISSTDIKRYLDSQEEVQRADSDDALPTTGKALIESIFSGAPQFGIQRLDGTYIPSVSFPWDFSLEVRDASDCLAIQHPAFSASTTYSHLVPQYKPCKHAAEYGIGIREVPNMLHASGREPGTVGFIHFLEEPLSDAFESKNTDETSPQTTQSFRTDPESLGIRSFDASVIAEHLQELGKIYRNYCDSSGKTHMLKDASECQIYGKLFTQLLIPPQQAPDDDDPTGLKVQISVLIDLLNLPGIWFDFSLAEWRIKLGALLWPSENDTELETEGAQDADRMTDRQVVILQFTLACELLLRLDAVSAVTVDELFDELKLNPDSIADFEARETKKSKWDLWLARYFLRNTDAKMTQKIIDVKVEPKQERLSIFSFITPQSGPETQHKAISDVVFVPRNLELQLGGLARFAKGIGWEDVASVEKQIRYSLSKINQDSALPFTPSNSFDPRATPGPFSSRRNDYFENESELTQTSTPEAFDLQALSPARRGSNTGGEFLSTLGGWLTRTYLTGVVLPGEAISHYLISTLLENDLDAVAKLGVSASLYGGFTYHNKSWWSKSCVVGRVLGALETSKECMGWIQTCLVPESITDSWISVKSDPVIIKAEARIKQIDSVQADTAFINANEVEIATTESFNLPQDAKDKPLVTVEFQSLLLKPHRPSDNDYSGQPADTVANERDRHGLEPQTAFLSFYSKSSATTTKVSLRHLVSFVSAFPCFPPTEVYSKTFESIPDFTGHAIHKSHTYRTLSATDILSKYFEQPSTSHTAPGMNNDDGSDVEVLVIDARGNATLALLARAWCAYEGKHAVIGRVGTTCLACCVREARVLAMQVVIRID